MATESGPGEPAHMGFILGEMVERFETEEQAEMWLISQRWPGGVACPSCQSKEVSPRPTRKPQPFRCRSCRRDFSVRTGSVLQHSNITLRQWVIGFHVLAAGLEGMLTAKLHRDLGVSTRSARQIAHRVREAVETMNERGDT